MSKQEITYTTVSIDMVPKLVHVSGLIEGLNSLLMGVQ